MPNTRVKRVKLLTDEIRACFNNDYKSDLDFKSGSGLYVFVFVNSTNSDIHDRNRSGLSKESFRQSGRVVVPARSCVIKFGKYESYFHTRLKSYARHMHYSSQVDRMNGDVFRLCLEHAIVFDLDGVGVLDRSINASRVFEQLWNNSLSFYLKENGLLVGAQNQRSEYRGIKELGAEDLIKLLNFVDLLAENILSLASYFSRSLRVPRG